MRLVFGGTKLYLRPSFPRRASSQIPQANTAIGITNAYKHNSALQIMLRVSFISNINSSISISLVRNISKTLKLHDFTAKFVSVVVCFIIRAIFKAIVNFWRETVSSQVFVCGFNSVSCDEVHAISPLLG